MCRIDLSDFLYHIENIPCCEKSYFTWLISNCSTLKKIFRDGDLFPKKMTSDSIEVNSQPPVEVNSDESKLNYTRSRRANGRLLRQINRAIVKERLSIEADLATYPSSVIESDIKSPSMSLLVTTWRSGSTFLGEVLNSHPVFRKIRNSLTKC